MPPNQFHALVFGASGVSGWAIAKECLKYPTPETFHRVTALTNRPLAHEDSLLPTDSRLHLASGVDLTQSVSAVQALLKEKVALVETVTHVFFTAYIETPDYPSLVQVNKDLLETAMKAVDQLCGATHLQHVILQTGGKAYGVEFVNQGVKIPAPLSEKLPRVQEHADKIFYYHQYDSLAALAKGKPWTFTEVRPDVIVGFTPGTNFMNAAQGLGFYLTLWRAIHGDGSDVPFPGSQKAWTNKHTDTSQDILARFEIFAALNGDKTGNGRSFNSSDGPVVTWEEKWPRIAAFFGLKGTGPGKDSGKMGAMDKWAKDNEGKWKELEQKNGLKTGIYEKYSWGFIDGVTIAFDFDRQYDMSAVREAGFQEMVDTVQDGYVAAFQRMRKAKIIP
ncbi:MAG: hypothetical protein Q9159_003141 [Coniocarpon cinnabarinum]